MSKSFFVIDGHHFIFRAYYAMQNMKRWDWFPTWAIFWVASMLFNLIEKENPDYLAFTFDFYKSFRHDKCENYKANRKETPDDLKKQMEIIYKMVEKMWVPIFAVEGYEADDVMWTIAEINSKDDDFITYLVTWDMDAMQLVLDDKVIVATPNKGYRDPIYYNEDKVLEKYNLHPNQIVCFKSMAWDSSDNIKWIEWIWEIWAKKLLKEFGSIEWIYDNLDKIKWSVKNKLKSWENQLDHLIDMTTIRKNVPMNFYSKESCKFNWISFDVEKTFEDYECNSLIRRLHKLHSDNNMVSDDQMTLF